MANLAPSICWRKQRKKASLENYGRITYCPAIWIHIGVSLRIKQEIIIQSSLSNTVFIVYWFCILFIKRNTWLYLNCTFWHRVRLLSAQMSIKFLKLTLSFNITFEIWHIIAPQLTGNKYIRILKYIIGFRKMMENISFQLPKIYDWHLLHVLSNKFSISSIFGQFR